MESEKKEPVNYESNTNDLNVSLSNNLNFHLHFVGDLMTNKDKFDAIKKELRQINP